VRRFTSLSKSEDQIISASKCKIDDLDIDEFEMHLTSLDGPAFAQRMEFYFPLSYLIRRIKTRKIYASVVDSLANRDLVFEISVTHDRTL